MKKWEYNDKILINYLECYMGDLSISPIKIFNHFCVSIWIHRYLWDTLGYNPILLYFTSEYS
jgi:hypothetical protein